MDGNQHKQALLNYLESPCFIQVASSSTRLVAKLKVAVQKDELYETHQILRTVYFRFSNYNEKLQALTDLLYHGAIFLVQAREFISGQDIGALILEIASRHLQNKLDEPNNSEAKANLACFSLTRHLERKTFDLEVCQKIAHIAVQLPPTEVGQPKFIAEALKTLHPKVLNRDLLHNVLANQFLLQKDYANARYHFLHCANLENAQDIAQMLVDYHSRKASQNEIDLFITQFILQFLSLQSPLDPLQIKSSISHGKRDPAATTTSTSVSRKTRSTIKSIAEKIFTSYTLRHPKINQVELPYSSQPLLNFIYFIITLLDSNNQNESITYQMLRDIYRASWIRDPNYQNYLSRIGSVYFGIVDRAKQQQQQQQGGFLNNILMSLLEGTDDDDDDSNQDGANVLSCDELD